MSSELMALMEDSVADSLGEATRPRYATAVPRFGYRQCGLRFRRAGPTEARAVDTPTPIELLYRPFSQQTGRAW